MSKRAAAAFACILAIFAFTATTCRSHAQAIYGSIYGTVTDNTGAAIPNASVTVTDESKGTVFTTTTNATGSYLMEHLIPDTYDVKVTMNGFKTGETKGIKVFVDTSPQANIQLEVGGESQTVTVNADTIPELKTDRADVSTEFSARTAEDLPIPNRNFTGLQLLLPGAQALGWSHAADENPQGSQQIQVDGQAFGGVAYELDGTDNQDPILGIIVINPPLDAIAETKITTQNFDAEFGKAVASVIVASTKSGSNDFHGSLFDYRESNANLARDPIQQPPGVPFPVGLRNQFGGSLGGRIIKDKLFFFGDYQGLRQKTGISNTATVPSALLTATCLGQKVGPSGIPGCDFSEYLANGVPNATIYQQTPAGPVPFAGNTIPRALLSPQALNFLKGIQQYAPNTSGNYNGLQNNYVAGGTGGFNNDQWDVRVDDQVTDKIHAFTRFSRFTSILTGTTMFGASGGPGFGLNGYGGTSHGADDSLAAGADIALNATVLTDFRIGYYRYNIGATKYNEGIPFAQNLGIPGMNLNAETSGAPSFNIADVGAQQLGGVSNPTDGGPQFGSGLNVNRCNCPLIEREDQFQFVNNWTKILGNHSIKFGADLRYARNLRVPSDTDRTGIIGFGTGPTSNGSTGGLGFASLVLGDVTTYGRYVSVSTNAKEFQKRDFFYGQDTWRATPKLTVNYGLRYEFYFPESVNGKGHGSLMNLNDGYLHVADYGNVPSDMGWKLPSFPFAPRVGVAYQLDDKTVIRAGYGRSFDIGVFGSVFGHVSTQNLPVLANQELTQPNGPTSTAFTLAQGPPAYVFPAVPANGLLPAPGYAVNNKARPNSLRLPTLDAWNLSIQRSLTPTLSVTLAYVGNKGTHTLSAGDGNTTNPNEAGIFLPANASVEGRTLHYDPTAGTAANPGDANGITANGGVSNQNLLQRYYGGTLAACQDPNYATPTGSGYPGVVRGMCGWTQGISYYGDNQNTHFNALQVTIDKQLSHNLSLTSNYAWQRSINFASSYSTWSEQAVKGRDDSLREQQEVVYATYLLPFGHNQRFGSNVNGIVNQIINGWQISPVVNWSSGLPFTLGYAECGAAIPSDAPCYPNGNSKFLKVGQSHFDPVAHSWTYFHGTKTPLYNTKTGVYTPFSGFSAPGLDQIGTTGRNAIFGPHFFNTDLSLQKSFPIHQSLTAILRVDGYNAFNHINAGNPSQTNIDGGNGVITGGPGINNYTNPRQLQFSGRFQF